MEPPVLSARGVVKRYGALTAVAGLDVCVERGECYGLLGPNGAGKSTLFRLLTGLARLDGGELEVFGLSVREHATEIKARLGVVGQEDSLDPDLDVWENLRTYGRYFGLRGEAFRARCEELLSFLELDGKRRAPIMALSGGMKRRLAIVRALVNEPEFLLLDEPTTGLDPQIRHAIWNAVRQLKARGLTILLTTHYMEEAAQLADRVGVIDHGRLIVEGRPADVVAAHLPPYVLEFSIARQDPGGWAPLREEALLYEEHGDRAFLFHEDEALLRVWGGRVSEATLRRTSLEDVFLKLTGRSLRD
ncbi:MAG: ABC transporter ATP-binding protein [Planctomycetota bacterium]|nr:MAG: ABC transporter ATP-binding protein [Planctomycetota bacterium]